ncbi:MAG: hypothetical protein AUG51_20135 [Acidobacteria bacterium 13_1_20CM_3_53_8]|nr:MAG: hypothetical protein AUG51_20135 [Acidobacteria bacterium 13_1_20CM_3_53_8]
MKFAITLILIQLLFAPNVLSLGSNRKRVQEGAWGGQHIGMKVTRSGATIQYDCASGTIDEPLVLDRSGRFTARGKHIHRHPGPIRVNEPDASAPAIYTGRVVGNHMTLTVTLAGSRQTVGTFELGLGQDARVVRCL